MVGHRLVDSVPRPVKCQARARRGRVPDERIVAYSLHKDRAVIVARRSRNVDLDRQPQVFLQQFVVDVLNVLEPCHAGVVDVVRFVVENGKFVDFAHDFT